MLRKCLDEPLKRRVFSLEQSQSTRVFVQGEMSGRYLPQGEDLLVFEYWRRCTPEEVAIIKEKLHDIR